MFATARVGIAVSAAVAMVVSGDCVPSAPTIDEHFEDFVIVILNDRLNLDDEEGERVIDTEDRMVFRWVMVPKDACHALTSYS